VYLGRSPGGRRVAVKVVRRSFAGDPRYAARFRREVDAARKVTGAFTAPVLDADPDAATPWLVTAYLPGMSLREAVAGSGALPPDAVRTLAAGLAEALAAIHGAGVVHRDLKPGNVMLTADGPRVIDFGIARPEDATAITRVGAPIGTPGFMAPEQLRAERAGPAADVFAMGATLVYAATGAEPFGSGPPRSRDLRAMTGRADLDAITEPWLLDLVERCLRVAPEDRPSAVKVLELLGPPDEDALSPLAARWLPPPIAKEIDHRTAEAGSPPGSPAPPHRAPTLAPDDAVQETAPPAERVGRRALLAGAGAGAGVLAAGGLGTVLWRRARGRDRDRNGGSGARTPGRSRAPEGPPPEAVPRWTRRVSDDYLELAAADGVVLANGSDGDEILHALDARTGKVLWKRDGGSSGILHRGVAYLSLNEATEISAVRARSGRTLWTYSAPFGEYPGAGLAVTDPVVSFGSDRVTALNLDDGRRRWTAKTVGRERVAAADGLVLALSSKELVGLDARTGRKRWRYPMDFADYQLIGDGLAFACDRFGTLHAVRADTGALVWRRGEVAGWGCQVGGGRLYVEGHDGEVLALDSGTGRQVWSRRLARFENDPRGQATALSLDGAMLYVTCTDGNLYALSAADGRVQWKYGAEEPNRIQPVSTGGLVFICTRDGRVQAVAPPAAAPDRNGGPRATP
ncbi:serine/threonine-protein kinase, partial [Actinomadura rubrisoli]